MLDDHVLLPWHRHGKARSGLRRKGAAVTSWQAEIAADDVQQVVGILPPAVIAELLAKVAGTVPPQTDAEGNAPGGPSITPPPAPSS